MGKWEKEISPSYTWLAYYNGKNADERCSIVFTKTTLSKHAPIGLLFLFFVFKDRLDYWIPNVWNSEF